ncbi:hypothetical protein A2U01_0065975, partial [Trifolium medium]|nr:hypothetical protein [Trifolium medium]
MQSTTMEETKILLRVKVDRDKATTLSFRTGEKVGEKGLGLGDCECVSVYYGEKT